MMWARECRSHQGEGRFAPTGSVGRVFCRLDVTENGRCQETTHRRRGGQVLRYPVFPMSCQCRQKTQTTCLIGHSVGLFVNISAGGGDDLQILLNRRQCKGGLA